MENQLKKLTNEEITLLMEAPVLVSLMAISQDGNMDHKERNDAIEMAHLRTYTSDPLLRPYYKLAEESFTTNLNALSIQFDPLDGNQKSIENRLKKIYALLEKLNPEYSRMMKESLKSYAYHVATVHPKFSDFFDYSNFGKF